MPELGDFEAMQWDRSLKYGISVGAKRQSWFKLNWEMSCGYSLEVGIHLEEKRKWVEGEKAW